MKFIDISILFTGIKSYKQTNAAKIGWFVR